MHIWGASRITERLCIARQTYSIMDQSCLDDPLHNAISGILFPTGKRYLCFYEYYWPAVPVRAAPVNTTS